MKRPSPTPFPKAAAVIVAAGQGLRAGQPVPKQFAIWRGKPVVRHSAEAFARAGISPVIVAIPDGADEMAITALRGVPGVRMVIGGATRQESVRMALESLVDDGPDMVLIHDAARPLLPGVVISRLLAALETHRAAIPVLPLADSLVHAEGEKLASPANREALRRVQTPQAFRFADILNAHRSWIGPASAGDDARVAHAAGLAVALVEGDEALHKLTWSSDFAPAPPVMRVGSGFDVHRLVECEDLWLCGVRIDHPSGLAGHSDADVAIHALVDAILGALGEGDIGQHFPPSDPRWRKAGSDRFLAHAVRLAADAGFAVGNADVTIICEEPRIGPHRDAMRSRLAVIMGVDIAAVSVKATTTEKLGYTGRGEGISAQAVVLLVGS